MRRNYSNFDARPATSNYYEFGGLQIEGSLLSSNIEAATAGNATASLTGEAGEVKPTVERVKRGSKFDKAHNTTTTSGTRERAERTVTRTVERTERTSSAGSKPFSSSRSSTGRAPRSRPLDDSTDDIVAATISANTGGSSRPPHTRERPSSGPPAVAASGASERPKRGERPERTSTRRGPKSSSATGESSANSDK